MKLRDRILNLLPMGDALVRSLVDGTAAEIDECIKHLQRAGLIGQRTCPATGRALLCDRRSSRTDGAPTAELAVEPLVERKVKRASFRHEGKRKTKAERQVGAMLRGARA